MKHKIVPFIRNPFINEIMGLFDSLREKKKRFNVSSCMLITGESGSGKSELAKQYLSKNVSYDKDHRTYIPVLHYELNAISTPAELIRSLLIAIGDPQCGEGARNAKVLFDRFVTLCSTVRVELIILDEVQVIIERRSARVLTGIADLFKDLIKTTGIPIIFMGMPWSKYLIDANEQLKGRVSYRYVIPAYKVSENALFNEYRKLLKSFANHYKFPDSIKIENKEMAFRIYSYSCGNLRKTAALICDVYMHSKLENIDVDINIFVDVVKKYGIDEKYNPFLLPVNKLELKEIINNSDWDFGARNNKNSIVTAEYIVLGITENNKLYSRQGVA